MAAGATLAATAAVGYGTATTLRGPAVKRVTIPLAKLPRTAHGFRIAVVSDIHLGPILGRAHTRRVVDTINRTNPDLVAIVGDLADGNVTDLAPAAAPLRELRARQGAFFVTGNHEYYSGADQWIDHVRELGIRPLENVRTELPGFDLAGVNDVAGRTEQAGPDYDQALSDRDPTRAVVLMAHQPVTIHDSVRYGVDLQLSGHTHGGQMWPFTHIADATNPTVAGLERYGDTQLYVSAAQAPGAHRYGWAHRRMSRWSNWLRCGRDRYVGHRVAGLRGKGNNPSTKRGTILRQIGQIPTFDLAVSGVTP